MSFDLSCWHFDWCKRGEGLPSNERITRRVSGHGGNDDGDDDDDDDDDDDNNDVVMITMLV